mmetsp:Transcript_39323/g.76983  ORF Transcript_39323/g.76983 Transcript_39323/m.76983 type:complete len:220 (+) Transcript_39323:102-761(+)
MPRSRKAVRNKSKKVTRVDAKKKFKGMKEVVVGGLWKEKRTVRGNYAAMGLAAAVNSDACVANDVQTSEGRIETSRTSTLTLGTGQLQVSGSGSALVGRREEHVDSHAAEAVDMLEEATQYPAPPRLFMFEGGQEFVETLLKKHGPEEYAKMARDRANVYQHTPAQIKKKVLKYLQLKAEWESGERGSTQAEGGQQQGRKGSVKLPNSNWNISGQRVKI